jgi:uncharacterized protein DUF5674
MDILIVKASISKDNLRAIAKGQFGNLVKAVVDLGQGIMAVGGELHADEEVILVEREHAKRENTWGINIYPDKNGDGMVEFDSMINLKPAYGNRSRSVEDVAIQKKIKAIVKKMVT